MSYFGDVEHHLKSTVFLRDYVPNSRVIKIRTFTMSFYQFSALLVSGFNMHAPSHPEEAASGRKCVGEPQPKAVALDMWHFFWGGEDSRGMVINE
jgi:hypothetical protein